MAGASSMKSAGGGQTDLVALIKFLISNCLSYGVVVGASILKVPQILNILRSGSADGISLVANYVELASYVISTSWGIVQKLAFRDFGENFFIFLQVIILVMLIAKLQKKLQSAMLVVAAELIAFYLFSTGILPRAVHQSLLSAQILLNISSRVPQIMLNYKNSSTGQLSFLTFFLAFGGGVARVLTTMLNVPWEKGKAVMLAQFGVAASLNAIVISQILYYHFQSKESKKTVTTAAPGSGKAKRD